MQISRIGRVARREFGSGISAGVDAMARFGLLHLHGGVWGDERILPAPFISPGLFSPGAALGK